MITWSGVRVLPENGNVPRTRDLAVAMCRITRYAGALWCPLAAHSLLVADLMHLHVGGSLSWAHGLLHDAHECVTGELTKWWKPGEMKLKEQELDRRLFSYFHLDYTAYRMNSKIIKEADERALCAEAKILGLPGWEEFRRARHASVPTLTTQELFLAERILKGMWTQPSMVLSDSPQVEALARALALIFDGQLTLACLEVSQIGRVPGK